MFSQEGAPQTHQLKFQEILSPINSVKTPKNLNSRDLKPEMKQHNFNRVELINTKPCGSVVQWLGRWTCNQHVVGSTPDRRIAE